MYNKLEIMFRNKEFNSLIKVVNEKIRKKKYLEDGEILIYGATLTLIEKFDYALKCFNKIKRENHCMLFGEYTKYYAICLYAVGRYRESKEIFYKMLEHPLWEVEAAEWIELLDLKDSMRIIETSVLRFHFDKEITRRRQLAFVKMNMQSFRLLEKVFCVSLPKKVDVYVYERTCDNLENKLSYANPALCMIHVNYYHTHGHELVHVMSHHLHEYMIKSRFIDEGVAVYFDKPYYGNIFDDIKKAHFQEADVFDVWKNFSQYAQEYSYKLAGLFVGYLIHIYSVEKFILFLREQTIENAQRVFGESFFDNIKEFESLIRG